MPAIDSISTTHPRSSDRFGVPATTPRRAPRLNGQAALDSVVRSVDLLHRKYELLQACLACLQADFGTLTVDCPTLRADVATLRADVSALKTAVQDCRTRMRRLGWHTGYRDEGRLARTTRSRLHLLEGRVRALADDLPPG